MNSEEMEWQTSQENSTCPDDKTEDDIYSSKEEIQRQKPSKPRDEAMFHISVDTEKPLPQRLLQKPLKAWFDQTFLNKIKEVSVKNTDDVGRFEVNVCPSSALHFLDYPTTIQLTIEEKNQQVSVTFPKTPELKPKTQPTDSPVQDTRIPMNVDITIDISHYSCVKKGVLLEKFKQYVHGRDILRTCGSFDVVEQFIKDVKAITGFEAGSEVAPSTAAAAETPSGVHSGLLSHTEQMTGDTIVPLTLFWYTTQAYQKELERIERDNGVQIMPEVKLSFKDTKVGEDSISNKAPEDFRELIRKCANDLTCHPIILPHSNPELPNFIRETQREKARCVLNVSSKGCTMFGSREIMPAIQEKYGIRQSTSVKSGAYAGASISSSENNQMNIGMGIKDPLSIDGLTMDLTHWKLMKTTFDKKISDIQKKFGVQFKENMVGPTMIVKAEPAGAVQAPSLESHALRALVLLYQRVATSTLSCSLIDPSQAREVEGKLEEMRSLHPFVGAGQENGPWRMIGLPEKLGPAVCDLEKNLGVPVFKEEEKKRIGYMSRYKGAVGGATAEGADEKDENCPICMDTFNDKEKLKCGHEFCRGCIRQSVASQLGATCPVCKAVFGQVEGDQPNGTMTYHKSPTALPGFPGCGCIIIDYSIPGGTQTKQHPSPGKPFRGATRAAYLPDNSEGNKVLKLLERAFSQKLIFTVGTSRTNGMDNCVTWNDVHHKTTISGGPTGYGYPDPAYLTRVQDELKAKGIE